MASPRPNARLTRTDAYALSRAFVGLSWSDVPTSPLLQALLNGLKLDNPTDMSLMRRVLGPDLIRQVLAENSSGEERQKAQSP